MDYTKNQKDKAGCIPYCPLILAFIALMLVLPGCSQGSDPQSMYSNHIRKFEDIRDFTITYYSDKYGDNAFFLDPDYYYLVKDDSIFIMKGHISEYITPAISMSCEVNPSSPKSCHETTKDEIIESTMLFSAFEELKNAVATNVTYFNYSVKRGIHQALECFNLTTKSGSSGYACFNTSTHVPLVLRLSTGSGDFFERAGSFATNVDFPDVPVFRTDGCVVSNGRFKVLLHFFSDYSGPMRVFTTTLVTTPNSEYNNIDEHSYTGKSFAGGESYILEQQFGNRVGNTVSVCTGEFCVEKTCENLDGCFEKSLDRDSCNLDKNCIFFREKCIVRTCSFLNQSDCVLKPDCYWNESACLARSCQVIKKERDCTEDINCHWQRINNFFECVDKKCWNIKDEEECLSSSLKCIWDKNNCDTPNCGEQRTEEDCLVYKNFGCYWAKLYMSSEHVCRLR